MAGSVVRTIQVLRDGSRCSTSILWTMVQMMGKLKVVVYTRVCVSLPFLSPSFTAHGTSPLHVSEQLL